MLKFSNLLISVFAAISSYLGFRFITQALQKGKNAKLIPYPRNVLGSHTAKNAVTGGHPEEMNGMPPELLPHN